MQFKNAASLKKFIIWAKEQHIAQLKVGEVEIVFSGSAFLPPELQTDLSTPTRSQSKNELMNDGLGPAQAATDEELFWSAD